MLNRRYLLGAIAVAGVLALLLGYRPLFLVTYAGVAAIAIAPIWSRLQTAGVQAEIRSSTEYPQAGRPLEVEVSLIERGGRPHWGLRVHIEDSASANAAGGMLGTDVDLAPHAARWWPVQLAPRHRGINQVGPIRLQGQDPLGLDQHDRYIGARRSMLVYPRIVPVPSRSATGGREGLNDDAIPMLAHGVSSISRLREYSYGDPLSKIHWPTSARLGRLITAEREDDVAKEGVWLFLDLQRAVQAGSGEESTEEYAITLAASLAVALLDEGVPVGLAAHGAEAIDLPPARGPQQRQRVMDGLAVASAAGRAPLPALIDSYGERIGQAGRLIVISPSPQPLPVGFLSNYALSRGWLTVVALDASSFSTSPQYRRASGAGNAIVVRQGEGLEPALEAAFRGSSWNEGGAA